MPTINNVHNYIQDLANAQVDVLAVFNAAASNIQADKNSAQRLLKSYVEQLVATDDDARYAELTKALSAFGPQFNFTGLVRQWRDEDKDNRTEYRNYEGRWGSREELSHKVGTVKDALEGAQSALDNISPQIEKFDEITRSIAEHNKEYPKAQITEENHDGYEKWGFWRFMGWLTFINRGPHKAYQIVNGYTKDYGDFYEDAKTINQLRSDEAKLKGEAHNQQGQYNELSTALQGMDNLNATLKGPEKMAQIIRERIADAMIKTPGFASALLSALPDDAAATQAVAEATKLYAFSGLATTLSTKQTNAKKTHELLKDFVEDANYALGRVGYEQVYYDTGLLESSFTNASRTSRDIARRVSEASDSLETYRPVTGTPYKTIFDTVTDTVQSIVNLGSSVNNTLTPNFNGLKEEIRQRVDAYEKEQARLREIERQKNELERQTREALNNLQRAQNQMNRTA